MVAELAESGDAAAELVAVVAMPPDELDRLTDSRSAASAPAAPLITVFDRPSQPGNIGTPIRPGGTVCSGIVSIPMAGSASSLNAATAGSIVLYKAMRQRTTPS